MGEFVTQEQCSERMSRMHSRMDTVMEGFIEVKNDIKWIKRLLAIIAILAGKYMFGVDISGVFGL